MTRFLSNALDKPEDVDLDMVLLGNVSVAFSTLAARFGAVLKENRELKLEIKRLMGRIPNF